MSYKHLFTLYYKTGCLVTYVYLSVYHRLPKVLPESCWFSVLYDGKKVGYSFKNEEV